MKPLTSALEAAFGARGDVALNAECWLTCYVPS